MNVSTQKRRSLRYVVGTIIVLALGCLALRAWFCYESWVVMSPYRSLVSETPLEKDVIGRIGNPGLIITSEEMQEQSGRFRPYAETGISVEGKVFLYREMVGDSYAYVYVFFDRDGRAFDARLQIL